MNYLNIDTPVFFAFLDTNFFYDLPPSADSDRVIVEVFNFTSIPQRCAMFSVMTEYGSQHARVPIHYLTSKEYPEEFYDLDWLQLWDSMSYYASLKIDSYTKNRAANIILKNKKLQKAKYLFTIDWCFGPHYQYNYGEIAAGHKCGHFFAGENGQYFLQPNNRVLWLDGGSFISKKFDKKPDWKVFSQEFSCENTGSKWISESDEELYFYEFKVDYADNNGTIQEQSGETNT